MVKRAVNFRETMNQSTVGALGHADEFTNRFVTRVAQTTLTILCANRLPHFVQVTKRQRSVQGPLSFSSQKC
jgi:hypothetical protein